MICPLLSIAKGHDASCGENDWAECKEEKCAWYVGKFGSSELIEGYACSIQNLAQYMTIIGKDA